MTPSPSGSRLLWLNLALVGFFLGLALADPDFVRRVQGWPVALRIAYCVPVLIACAEMARLCWDSLLHTLHKDST